MAAFCQTKKELRDQVRKPLFPEWREKRIFPALTGESLDDAQNPKNEVPDIENENQQAEQKSEYPPNQRDVGKDLQNDHKDKEHNESTNPKIDALHGPMPHEAVFLLDEIEDDPSNQRKDRTEPSADVGGKSRIARSRSSRHKIR